ncbi:MAG: hypothetical protein ACI835_000067 [Planctomycetota bacterium]|jgi:hypothetical protein
MRRGTAIRLSSSVETSGAFTLAGWSLDLGQRDFRVFDNSMDQEANDSPSSDSSFPGYQGATMAIWKASVEWGS